MAIETIRDLAFKVSMNIQLDKLRSADKAVDKFKSKVVSLQRSVSKSVDIMNNKFNNVNTFKAQKRINDVTKAIQRMKQEKMDLNINTSAIPNAMKTKPTQGGTQVPKVQPPADVPKRIPSAFEKIYTSVLGTNKGLGLMKVALGKILPITSVISGIMSSWKYGVTLFNQSIDKYRDYMVGLTRVQTYFANDFQYRQQMLGESLVPGAKTFKDFQKGSKAMVDEALANVDRVAKKGVIGYNNLQMMVGQLASFQIDLKAWFGGAKGMENIEYLADLMTAIQTKGGSVDDALRVANMIGKADAMGLFGQLQRWGIVLTDNQKKIIKTGNEYERLGALMQGLKQNVGHLNQEMAKTPLGRQMALNTQISSAITQLGKHTIHAKNAFTELKLAIMPISSILVRIFSAALGIIAKVVTSIINAVNWLFTSTEKTSNAMKFLKLAIISVGAVLAMIFAPFTIVIAKIALIGLLIEDLWVAFHGGKAITAPIVNWLKESFVSLLDGAKKLWEYIKKRPAEMKQEWNDFVKQFKSSMLNLGQEIKNLFLGIFQSIGDFFTNMINSIPEKIEKVKKWAKSWSPFGGDEEEEQKPNLSPTPVITPITPISNPDELFNNTNLSDISIIPSTNSNGYGVNKNNNFNLSNGAIQLNITTSKEINKDTLLDLSMDAFDTAIKQSISSYEGGFDD